MSRAVWTVLSLAGLLLALDAAAEPQSRFLSLKTEGANGRHGPGIEHRIDWIYDRRGLPLEVLGQSGPWRRVRDPDGAVVWMHNRNLEQRHTAYVLEETILRRMARESASPIAVLAPGVVGAVTGCEGQWRRVAIAGRVGWVRADALWGGECVNAFTG